MSSINALTSPASKQAVKKSVSPKKTSKTKASKADNKSKSISDHPPYKSMVKKALNELKEKKGSSRLAILKFIISHFHLGENPLKINARLKMALKKGVESGFLKQTKGIGASGSFILREDKGSKTTEFSKKVKQVKPKAKNVKKATGVKKPSVKKAKATPKKKPFGKKVALLKAIPAVSTPPTVTPAVTQSINKKAKSAKIAKMPKKLNVAKKLPIKKASAKKPKIAKKPKASGGKKPVKKANAGTPASAVNA